MSKYDVDMGRRSANHVPLSPLSFLQRTASVYPERCAIRYGKKEWTWAETHVRCRALADALRRRGVEKNDTVAVLCHNTPPAVEVSFGVPMAGLLGILTGLLAFLPNIGAIISGVLIVLVGFSGGMDTGLYAVGVYLVVQIVDGYLIVPMVAKRAVDLAPALVLAAQILFGALFGIIGLFLADPIVAMIKVYLEERSKASRSDRDKALLQPADG